MEFNLNTIEALMKNGKVEVQDGVFLVCEKNELKLSMCVKDNNVIIKFDAPFIHLHVEKLGPKKLINLVNPRIEQIIIKEKSFNVKLSTLGSWEFDRS